MKLDLDHIETVLRKQFVWDKKDQTSRWHTKEDWNLKSSTVGLSVFTGVAQMFGFTLDAIKDHVFEPMGIGPHDVDNQARVFEERMAKMRDRIALEVDGPKEEDLVQLAYKKTKLVCTAIRLNYLDRGWVDPLTYVNY